MKIAVLGTSFLENYVMEELKKIRIPGSVDYYNYESFSTIGRLYAQLCSDYDGFLTSGPLPLAAIRRYVGELPRPIVPFGLDAVSYYEAFFRILYKERDPFFEKGYFDLLDMQPERFSLCDVLKEGTFWSRMTACYKHTARLSIAEYASMEERLIRKHIELYKNGNINYSVTRLSSIMPALLEAGCNVYFIYPTQHLLQNAVNELITNIHLSNLLKTQTALVNITRDTELQSLPASGFVIDDGCSAAEIARKSGISPQTIKKVMKALDEIGTNRVTSKLLANAMDLNIRSANRLLSKLTECGLAEILSEQMFSRKGRPERIYRVFQDYMSL